ncbi:MAG: hypothetical protein AAF607_15470 [Pseudomonadota bacterium]
MTMAQAKVSAPHTEFKTVPDDTQTQSELALQLLTITTDLTTVLDDESAALSGGQADAIEALGQRKTDLFAIYAGAMESIQQLGTTRLDIKDTLRKSLRAATLQFKASLERNQRLLKTQLDISKGMMQAIGEEAERQQNPVKTYASPGTVRQPRKPTSLALNQTI